MRVIVPEREVLCTSVVPKGDGTGLPLESALKLGLFDVLEKHLKDRIAFAFGQLGNMGGKCSIDK